MPFVLTKRQCGRLSKSLSKHPHTFMHNLGNWLQNLAFGLSIDLPIHMPSRNMPVFMVTKRMFGRHAVNDE